MTERQIAQFIDNDEISLAQTQRQAANLVAAAQLDQDRQKQHSELALAA